MERRKDKKGRVLQKGERQRKDGLYVYQYKDICGKRKSVYSRDLSALRREERKICRDIEDNINSAGADITLNQLFDRYMALKNDLANSTRMNYIGLWECRIRKQPLGNKKISIIKKSDILNFFSGLAEEGLSYETLRTFAGIITPCFELAIDDDLIRKNPCRDCLKGYFRRDAEEKLPLTEQQQKYFLDFVINHPIYAKHYPMLDIMIETAVRCGELIGLTWDDVDFKSNTLHITHQLLYKKKDGKYQLYADSPKTRSGIRDIPMTQKAKRALLQQRKYQLAEGMRTNVTIDGYNNFCFSTKHRKPLMPSAINNTLYNIVRAYNIRERESADREKRPPELLPQISAHILRHTGCTRMAEAGVDPKVLQYIMGHNNIAVTMDVYNHVSEERNRKEMKKMEQIRLWS